MKRAMGLALVQGLATTTWAVVVTSPDYAPLLACILLVIAWEGALEQAFVHFFLCLFLIAQPAIPYLFLVEPALQTFPALRNRRCCFLRAGAARVDTAEGETVVD